MKSSTVIIKATKLIIIIIVLCITSGCKQPLFTKLNEADANEMMSILMINGIDAEKIIDKKNQTMSLQVEKDQIPTALSLLKQHGYPRDSFKKMIDIFDKQGLVSSPMEERVRFIYALTQEVQETLSQIDGVITARVHLVLPENNPFSKKVKPSSASVFIKSIPNNHIEEIKSEIKLIVEKSIEGLKYEKISVVILPANIQDNPASEASWSNIFGIRIPLDSLNNFKILVAVFSFITLALLVFSMYLIIKISNLTKDHENNEKAKLPERAIINNTN